MNRRRRIRHPIDQRTIAEAFSGPGNDPRQWISYGRVDGQTEDDPDPCVTFDASGPLVKVTLQPSGSPVLARVAAFVAGRGEGSYFPFVEGDEVLVALPEGSERAGPVIIGRLNNEIDTFPSGSVAGQDPTTNSFGFARTRTPWVEERAGPFLVRNALNGALLSLDNAGVVTIRGGDGEDGKAVVLQLSHDAAGIQGPSSETSPPEFLMQLDFTGGHFLVQVKDAILSISGSTASPEVNTLSVPGSLTIGTIGNAPIEHIATVEGTANVLFHEMTSLAAAITAMGGATPLTGASLGAAIAAWLGAGFPAGIATAAAAPLPSTVLAAIVAWAAAPVQKLTSPAGQSLPGLGCPGLLGG